MYGTLAFMIQTMLEVGIADRNTFFTISIDFEGDRFCLAYKKHWYARDIQTLYQFNPVVQEFHRQHDGTISIDIGFGK